MNRDMIAGYVTKVYRYAISHTCSRNEADELSQEILLTAIRELPKLNDDSKFEPWLWGIARNVTKSYRRYMGKQRAMYSYDMLDNIPHEDPYDSDQEGIEDSLRTEIAMLSAMYRDIIILYYYDGLSVKQISEKLKVPERTIMWRLSEARRKLKKEYDVMEYTALKPVKLTIRISGEGNYNGTTCPFPYVFINDALSQNILYNCYEEKKTVEELAKLCGVPAYYIEDCLSNLINREAILEVSKGKYRTAFIIYSGQVNAYTEEAKGIFEPILHPFVEAMKNLTDSVDQLEIYTAGKSKDELVYLYGMMALEYLSDQHNPVKPMEHPVRYDGCRWSYHGYLMEQNHDPARNLGRERSCNSHSRGTYQHISYHFGGFAYRKIMFDNQINICEDILAGNEIGDLDSAASTIEQGFIVRRDHALFVTVPALTKPQYEKFKVLADHHFKTVIVSYADAVAKYLEGYKKLFPAHLEDDVQRVSNYMFLSLYAMVLCDLAKEGLLKAPSPDSVCDVMIQYK